MVSLSTCTAGVPPGVHETARPEKTIAGRSRSVSSPVALALDARVGPAVEERPVVRVVFSFSTSPVDAAVRVTAAPADHSASGVGAVSVSPSMSMISTPDARASTTSAACAARGASPPSARSVARARATAPVAPTSPREAREVDPRIARLIVPPPRRGPR